MHAIFLLLIKRLTSDRQLLSECDKSCFIWNVFFRCIVKLC